MLEHKSYNSKKPNSTGMQGKGRGWQRLLKDANEGYNIKPRKK